MMGDANTILDAAAARHLLRRAGFGARRADVEDILDRQLTRGQAAAELLDFESTPLQLGGYNIETAHAKWLKSMIKTKHPLQSKLVLFWHDHFATSIAKVENVTIMGIQIALLHVMCKGNFKDFVKAINRDVAMMIFLDTVRNRKDIPNENYARELQELFTLGVYDFAGNANYTQRDVVQIARAFTGWSNLGFNAADHDYNAEFAASRGPKTIYQSTGAFGVAGSAFDANGEGTAEIDTVTDIIFDHIDSEGKNTVARRIARRLFEYFAYAITEPISPADVALIDQLVLESNFASAWDIGALVHAILVNDAFYESAAQAPFAGTAKKSVKWPMDLVVSTARMLRIRIPSTGYAPILDHLRRMGQTLLMPPDVFGWLWESGWISSGTLLARFAFARDVTAIDEKSRHSFRPEKFTVNVGNGEVRLVSLTDPDDIVLGVTDILGVTDQLTDVEHDVLVNYLTDAGSNPTIDLSDEDVRNRKLYGLFALVLQSPSYQLH